MSTRTLTDALKEIDIETKSVTATGGHPFRADDTVWDDLTIPIRITSSNNPNPPIMRLRNSSDSAGSENILRIKNGSSDDTFGYFSKTTNNSAENMSDFTVAFWFKAGSRGSGILALEGQLTVDVDFSDRLRMQYNSEGYEYLLDPVVYGKWYCLIIRIETLSYGARVTAYVNGTRKLRTTYYSTPNASWSDYWFVGARGGSTSTPPTTGDSWWEGDVDVEELRFFNVLLDSTQRSTFYNSGDGTANSIDSHETAWYDMNEANSATSFDDKENNNDGAFVGTHYGFVGGGVSGGTQSGLFSPVFEAGDNQQIEFDDQIRHKFADGSGFIARFHFHVQIRRHGDFENGYDPSFSTVLPKLKLEYTLTNVHEEEQSPLTLESALIVFSHDHDNTVAHPAKVHALVMWYVDESTGNELTKTTNNTDVTPSAMLSGRVYRDENDGSPYDVVLWQPDFHITIDKRGTDHEWHD